MPNPTSSESGKGTRGAPAPTLGLTGSGSRIRASQHDCSTVARSPSGERHPPAGRRATAPLPRPVAPPADSLVGSLARVETEAGKETNELGFVGKSVAQRFLFTARVARDRPSQMNGSQRFGPNVAQAGDEFHGSGLHCVLRFRAGWSGPYFVSLG
jgi:hypothetical protein